MHNTAIFYFYRKVKNQQNASSSRNITPPQDDAPLQVIQAIQGISIQPGMLKDDARTLCSFAWCFGQPFKSLSFFLNSSMFGHSSTHTLAYGYLKPACLAQSQQLVGNCPTKLINMPQLLFVIWLIFFPSWFDETCPSTAFCSPLQYGFFFMITTIVSFLMFWDVLWKFVVLFSAVVNRVVKC